MHWPEASWSQTIKLFETNIWSCCCQTTCFSECVFHPFLAPMSCQTWRISKVKDKHSVCERRRLEWVEAVLLAAAVNFLRDYYARKLFALFPQNIRGNNAVTTLTFLLTQMHCYSTESFYFQPHVDFTARNARATTHKCAERTVLCKNNEHGLANQRFSGVF